MKNHYRYYQRGEKSPWIAVLADGAEGEARAHDAKRLTVLATSAQLGGLGLDGEVPKDVRFHGPLYFDIDDELDLSSAIDSGRRLVKKLQTEFDMEDRDIQVFLSGKKGLHIFVQPECFGLTRSVVRLPVIYREMAKRLYVSGMDLAPYSVRNAFRLINVKRDDGRYRVPIHVRELQTLDEEKYLELTSQPRGDFIQQRPSGKIYTTLSVMFQACTEEAKKLERPSSDSSEIIAPVLKQHFSDDPPPCMHHLAEGKRAESSNFNQVATQVAIFAARLSPDGLGTFEPYWDRIADNQHSTSYANARQRKEHMEGQYKFMRTAQNYQFSCNAIRSVLKTRVCGECPLEAAKVIETPEDAAQMVGIGVRGDGYFDTSAKNGARRITSFTLVPEYTFNERDEFGQLRRIGTMVGIEANGKRLGETLMEERSWGNRAAFINALTGFGNASFFGNDTDIQKIRFMLTSDDELPEKTVTRETGMHIEDVDGKEVRTYVEPSMSVSNTRVLNSRIFQGINSMDPSLLKTGLSSIDTGDTEAAEAIIRLLNINDMSVTSVCTGWAVAAHLKAHLMYMYKQFPLVNLWGNASSGKTTIARFFATLGGTDYITEHEELNAPSTSPFPWLVALSNSTSAPAIIDEFNQGANRMSPVNYAKLAELLKGAFNGQAAGKGYLAGGGGRNNVQISNYRLLRPAIYCSEQQPDLPALVDRSLIMLCSTKAREERDGADRKVRERFDALRRVSYTLMLAALNTPTAEVSKMYESAVADIPEGIGPRPRYGHAVCLMGLRWLREVMEDRNCMTPELAEALDQAVEALLVRSADVAEEHTSKRTRNEVDKAFADIMEIVGESVQHEEDGNLHRAALRSGIGYSVTVTAGVRQLYLDVRGVHTAYLTWSRAKGQSVVLDKLETFARLAMEESYVLQMARNPQILNGRHAFVIDLDQAADRGLPTYYLGEVNEF